MTTAALKKKIKALVEKEQSARKLELAYALLTDPAAQVEEPVAPYRAAKKVKTTRAPRSSGPAAMRQAVARSEREFAAGEGISLAMFEKQMDTALEEVFADEPSVRRTKPGKVPAVRSKSK